MRLRAVRKGLMVKCYCAQQYIISQLPSNVCSEGETLAEVKPFGAALHTRSLPGLFFALQNLCRFVVEITHKIACTLRNYMQTRLTYTLWNPVLGVYFSLLDLVTGFDAYL